MTDSAAGNAELKGRLCEENAARLREKCDFAGAHGAANLERILFRHAVKHLVKPQGFRAGEATGALGEAPHAWR
jgi:hypothetical protein